MDYKTKYLKYKSKYFDLKNEIEGGGLIVGAIAAPFVALAGIAKGTQLLARNIKKMSKSEATTQEEINKIAEIVKKLKKHEKYPENKTVVGTNNKAMAVDKFLAFVNDLKKKDEAENISKLAVTITDLDFLLGKHYMCKKSQMSVFYDINECKLNKEKISKSDTIPAPIPTTLTPTPTLTTAPTLSPALTTASALTIAPSLIPALPAKKK